jgi:tetratricopeptide (TPR) repeat protein
MGMENASEVLSRGLDDLIKHTGDESLHSTEPYLASLLSIQKPGEAVIETDDENRHRKTMMVIRSVVGAIASTARTVLVLEDLHWIDSASRETLEFLIANCRTDKPLLLLCLYRPLWESCGSIFESIAEASAEKQELILDIVPDEGCRDLIRHMLDSKPHEDVEDFLITRSGGNPFFLEELILDLIETGALEENERGWCFSSPPDEIYIPSSLNNLIRSRIDRLQPLYRGGLQHCSVLGMDFLMKLYRRLHEKLSSEGRPDEIMDELTRRDFLRNIDDSSGMKYIFRHFLIHDSAYDTLLHRNRRLLHRFAAEALEELFAGESADLSPVIAHHWERTGNRKMSLLWGLKALATCRKTYQNQEGLSWVTKLSAWLEQEPQNRSTAEKQFQVFKAKQIILSILGRREEQELSIRELFAIAGNTGDSTQLAEAHTIRGQYLSVTGKMSEAQADFDTALELTSDEARVCLLIGENYFRRSMYAESLECYRKVLVNTNDFFLKTRVELSTAFICRIMGRTAESEAHLTVAGDLIRENEKGELPLLRARYYTRLADFESANDSTENSINHYGMAIDLFRNCGDMAGEAMVLNNMHWIYSRTGDLEKSLETLEEVVKIDREIDEALGIAIAYYNIAETYMEMDRLDEAEEYYWLYLELSEQIDNHLGEGYGTYGLGYLFMEKGDLLNAEKFFTQSSEVFSRLGGKEMETVARIALITLYIKDGRIDDARRILETLGQGSFSTSVQNSIHFMRGLVACKSSSSEDESALERAASHFRSSIDAPDHCNRIEIAERCTALASVLGLLGREDQRLEALTQGSEMLTEKLQMVHPKFRKIIFSKRKICGFMELCSEAGVPVVVQEPVSQQL